MTYQVFIGILTLATLPVICILICELYHGVVKRDILYVIIVGVALYGVSSWALFIGQRMYEL